VLVNNVGGVTVCTGGFASITDDDWQASWDLNMMGTVRPSRAVLPEMERRGGGSIVIVGSVNAYYSDPAIYDYCATKAAVTNFAKALSKELAPRNIRVNSVSPGPVSTGLWMDGGGVADGFADATGQTADAVKAIIKNITPGSPRRIRSPTWSSSLPATAPAIPPDLTCESTAASSQRSDAAQKCSSRRPYSR
jgi:NAD(P)-dependent dehydrogenase (short-subunit alcohol dehydrogenase family)